MPAEVEVGLRSQGLLRVDGPHAPATVRRRLTSWSILTRWRGLTGTFSAPSLKGALQLAVRATGRPRQRKSKNAVTAAVLAKLLSTCAGDRLVDMRDRALLLTAFASGQGRALSAKTLRPRPALRLSDRNRQSRPSAAGGDAAVAAQIAGPGGRLLQRSGPQAWQGGAVDCLTEISLGGAVARTKYLCAPASLCR